jgi:hypothetical protein
MLPRITGKAFAIAATARHYHLPPAAELLHGSIRKQPRRTSMKKLISALAFLFIAGAAHAQATEAAKQAGKATSESAKAAADTAKAAVDSEPKKTLDKAGAKVHKAKAKHHAKKAKAAASEAMK